jgi:uncharacterized protein (UPF0332 family)
MDKIKWCLKQKDGIQLVEPSSNLCEAYIKKAEDSLLSLSLNQVKEWKIATAYYASYFGVYAILQKLGVKCEIHTCTIKFTRVFLKEFFNEAELEFLEDSFQARKDSQYYVNRDVPDEIYKSILENTPSFLVKCKSIISKLNEKKIKEIRGKIEKYGKSDTI